MIQFLNGFPIKLTIRKTVVIIPSIVSKAVSNMLNPEATPSSGPPINFNILVRKTMRYLRIKLIIKLDYVLVWF